MRELLYPLTLDKHIEIAKFIFLTYMKFNLLLRSGNNNFEVTLQIKINIFIKKVEKTKLDIKIYFNIWSRWEFFNLN